MSPLQRLWAGSALSLFLLTGTAACAEDLSPQDQETVNLTHAFEDCVNANLEGIDQNEMEQDVNAYIQGRLDNNELVTQDDVFAYIQERYVNPVLDVCEEQEGIAIEELQDRIRDVESRHGPEVFSR